MVTVMIVSHRYRFIFLKTKKTAALVARQVTLECMAQREPICIGCGE